MHEKDRLANRYFRWNFTCLCLDGTFSGIGFALLGLSTFMPSVINQIAMRYPTVRPIENQLDMLIIVIFSGLSSLFGFFTIRYIEALKVRKPLFIALAIYARVLYLMIAVFIFLMPYIGYRWFLVGLYGTLFLYSLGNGAQVTLWSDMIGRGIPTNKRGMLFAIRDCTGNLLGMLAVALIPWLHKRLPFPQDFGWHYLLAGFFLFLTVIPLGMQKEIPYHEEELQPQRSLREQLVAMKEILVQDKAYRGFLISLIAASMLPIAQIPLYTAKALHLSDLQRYHTFLGSWMTLALTLGAATFTPVLGYVADRFGCKRLGYLSYSLTLVSLILIMLARNLPMVLAAILIAGFASGSSVQLTWNFPMEFAPENRRPSYLGLRSLWSVPFIFVPLLGGWLADHHGYDIVFAIAIGFTVLTLVLYKVLFPDPRQTRARQAEKAVGV